MPILPRGSNMEPEIRTKFVQSVAEAFGYALSDEIEIEQPAEELPTEE